jgi:Sulfatase
MFLKSMTLLRNLGTLLATVGIATLAQTALAQSPSRPLPTGSLSLPRPDFHFKGEVGRTYLDSDPATFPQIVRPPKGAPNIVLILLDDVGFGQFSVFDGGVSSPNMEKLAAQGLRYNRFHTTALCSPTRAALLTGRNHDMAGTGVITEISTGYDGYTGIIPKSAGTGGILIWCADRLQAVKWRNFKVHFYQQEMMVSPPVKLAITASVQSVYEPAGE